MKPGCRLPEKLRASLFCLVLSSRLQGTSETFRRNSRRAIDSRPVLTGAHASPPATKASSSSTARATKKNAKNTTGTVSVGECRVPTFRAVWKATVAARVMFRTLSWCDSGTPRSPRSLRGYTESRQRLRNCGGGGDIGGGSAEVEVMVAWRRWMWGL